MNKLNFQFLLMSIFLAIAPMMMQSQEIADTIIARASYDFFSKNHIDQKKYTKKDLMYLDIGKNMTKFYSRYEQLRDSVTREGVKEKVAAAELVELRRDYQKGDNTTIYQYFKMNRSTTVSTFLSYGYIYDEELKIADWKIKDETFVINGYDCKKAYAKFLGRNWVVFFSTEIPLNAGPWKLWGLPGLIVHAEDENEIFKFSLAGFQLIDTVRSIIYINTRPNGEEYEKISKQNFIKLERIFYDDFFSFIKLTTGKETTREDGKPLPKVSVDYIPLEPW